MRIVRYYPRGLVGDGGMTNSVKKWSAAMIRAGDEVVIAYDQGVEPPADTPIEWIPIPHSGRTRWKVPVGLKNVLNGADLLVLHSGWTFQNIRAGMVARKAGVRYVLEPRGAYDPHIVRRKRWLKRPWWVLFERRLVQGAHAIHVFFDEERDHLEALGRRGPFIIASNGVEAPAGEVWDGGSGGYFLWLGRFDPEHKGLDTLLRAVRKLPRRERPDLRLHGPDWHGRKADVGRMIDELGLGEHVTMGPAVYGADKQRLLVQAAGFVYPSRWDACPNSVLEAISLGIPTLVTPYPLGCHLAVRGGAFLVEGEPESLAAGLRSLGSPKAAAVGARGAQIARTELSWDQVARTWLSQARSLL
ncbi:MAG: glycosyltransferase [Gemmatimonadetes bacterium]|nr:glycosyltransferase [Gemmatimonadota bacterium]